MDCDPADPEPELGAHPLVRERFGARFETEWPDAWRAAHRCLFDWFRSVPGVEQPDGLEGLEPLYRAVVHGCRAQLFDAALNRVFENRIRRGDECFSLLQLGAVSADLSALAGFFPFGWSSPPATGDLSERDRSWLIGEVAFCLMFLSRIEEALEPRQMVGNRWRETGNWDEFCRSSENLVDLQTPLGRWLEAERTAQEGIDAAGRIANQSEAQYRRLLALAYLGRALHGQGRLAESAAAFKEAETLEAKRSPTLPTLNSLRGYDYDQLLLAQAENASDRHAVVERARVSLAYQIERHRPLSQAFDHCMIGQALVAGGEPGLDTEALAALDSAIVTIRRAGSMIDIPVMHLARAQHHRDQHHPAQAQADLDAALAIARRGNMPTYLAECALLEGHLHLDRLAQPTPAPATAEPIPEAARAWAQADNIIRHTGYGRRETELHLLEARLRHSLNPDFAELHCITDDVAPVRNRPDTFAKLRTQSRRIGE